MQLILCSNCNNAEGKCGNLCPSCHETLFCRSEECEVCADEHDLHAELVALNCEDEHEAEFNFETLQMEELSFDPID